MRILFEVGVGIAIVFSVAALFNLRGDGSLWQVFIRGPFAGKEWFTQRGWALRNLALVSVVFAAVCLFLS
jgi:hypothetical protein